jgi:DNA-binding MarR family transcriptional regulator
VSEDTVLLRAILSMTARQAFSVESMRDVVGTGEKQVRAFNMCDGSHSQGEISKALKIDPGNFSKTISRWIEAGILLRLGDGRDTKLLHIYPLPKTTKGTT